jgi:hypothetical protein
MESTQLLMLLFAVIVHPYITGSADNALYNR